MFLCSLSPHQNCQPYLILYLFCRLYAICRFSYVCFSSNVQHLKNFFFSLTHSSILLSEVLSALCVLDLITLLCMKFYTASTYLQQNLLLSLVMNLNIQSNWKKNVFLKATLNFFFLLSSSSELYLAVWLFSRVKYMFMHRNCILIPNLETSRNFLLSWRRNEELCRKIRLSCLLKGGILFQGKYVAQLKKQKQNTIHVFLIIEEIVPLH